LFLGNFEGRESRERLLTQQHTTLNSPIVCPINKQRALKTGAETGKMKVFSNLVTYNYSWEEVSAANWRKYSPWNEKCTHVVAVDTLSRSVDPETGILRSERLITCRQKAPEWLKAVLGAGAGESQVLETSYVDPARRTVTMISNNLTFSNLINVSETVVYRPLNDGQTQFLQDAKITALCGGWNRIRNAIEDKLVTRFHDNAVKGREGFEAVLAMSRRVFAEEREKEKERMPLSA